MAAEGECCGLLVMRVWTISVVLLAAVGAVVLPTRAATPPVIRAKQAEAARVLRQISAIDEQLSVVTERYDGQRVRLQTLRARLEKERRSLGHARAQYRVAERRRSAMLVSLYESDAPSALEVLVGASSLSDSLGVADAQARIGRENKAIAEAALRARQRLQRQVRSLERHSLAAAATVARLNAERATIEHGLAQRRALLSTVQAQITHLEAQERARQARLAALARARLEAQARAAQAREHAQAIAEARRQATQPRPNDADHHATDAAPATTTAQPTQTQAAAPAPPPAIAAPPTTPPPASRAPAATIPSPSQAVPGHQDAASVALRYVGVPYLWGGSSPAGFDCSGLVSYVFAQLGITLPHYAAAQWTLGTPVTIDQLQPGDLVFFDHLAHVGISLGGSTFVDAPRTGTTVRIDSLDDPWYAHRYVGARRI